MSRRFVALAAVLGMLGVMAGAFGAHGLRPHVEPAALEWWRTGAQYQMVHAAVLLMIALHPPGGRLHEPWRARAAWALALGIIIFAGTLYLMTLGGPRWLGAVTPVGGAALISGWAMTAIAALTGRDRGASSGSSV